MSTRWTGKNLSVDRDEIHADSGSMNPRVSRFLSKSPTQKLSEGLTPVSGISNEAGRCQEVFSSFLPL